MIRCPKCKSNNVIGLIWSRISGEEHKYFYHYVNLPTSFGDDYLELECEDCGHVWKENIDEYGHVWEENIND